MITPFLSHYVRNIAGLCTSIIPNLRVFVLILKEKMKVRRGRDSSWLVQLYILQ